MSQVYIGDLCHVLPSRVMDEFQDGSCRPWFGDGDVCNQYLYSEMSEEDYTKVTEWYDGLSDEEQGETSCPPRSQCDEEDDLGYFPE